MSRRGPQPSQSLPPGVYSPRAASLAAAAAARPRPPLRPALATLDPAGAATSVTRASGAAARFPPNQIMEIAALLDQLEGLGWLREFPINPPTAPSPGPPRPHINLRAIKNKVASFTIATVAQLIHEFDDFVRRVGASYGHVGPQVEHARRARDFIATRVLGPQATSTASAAAAAAAFASGPRPLTPQGIEAVNTVFDVLTCVDDGPLGSDRFLLDLNAIRQGLVNGTIPSVAEIATKLHAQSRTLARQLPCDTMARADHARIIIMDAINKAVNAAHATAGSRRSGLENVAPPAPRPGQFVLSRRAIQSSSPPPHFLQRAFSAPASSPHLPPSPTRAASSPTAGAAARAAKNKKRRRQRAGSASTGVLSSSPSSLKRMSSPVAAAEDLRSPIAVASWPAPPPMVAAPLPPRVADEPFTTGDIPSDEAEGEEITWENADPETDVGEQHLLREEIEGWERAIGQAQYTVAQIRALYLARKRRERDAGNQE